MQFTYQAYENLLELLKRHKYQFASYHNYQNYSRCVILRHDIDQSIKKAVPLGEIEAQTGVSATYFVLLTSDFYNPASRNSIAELRALQDMGHEIGLHFDEMTYVGNEKTIESLIQQEADILSNVLGTAVTTVSMHRPSKQTLESNLMIPDMINSYGKTFFNDFKYLSDSRRRWREPVLDIICAEKYDRLHILTHPFWYHDDEETISETVSNFVNSGNRARYSAMSENIADLSSIMQESEVR